MNEWWDSLTQVNRMFYGAAAFFSVFFIWQLLAALMGLDADDADVDVDVDVDADVDVDHTYDHFEDGAAGDAIESIASFKLLSVRSIVTFCTLFTWGCALYLNDQYPLTRAMGISTIWGLAGMFSVALIFYLMKRMAESGNVKLSTCVGTNGDVYLDIPEDGFGEVRVTVSGVVSYIKARSVGKSALKASTPIRVVRRIGQSTVEVEQVDETEKGKGEGE